MTTIDESKKASYIDGRLVIDEYKGVMYCYMNLSNLSEERGIDVLNQFIDFSKNNEFINPVAKILMDLEGTKITMPLVDKTKEYVECGNKVYSDLSIDDFNIALIGISDVLKLFVKTFSVITNGNVKTFENKPEALDWLVRFEEE